MCKNSSADMMHCGYVGLEQILHLYMFVYSARSSHVLQWLEW